MLQVKSHKGQITLLLFAFCFLVVTCVLVGCENLPNPFAKKAKEKTESPLVITGTLIAMVNNMPITLEDLNEEIINYNALVSEERPELRIVTPSQRLDYLKNEIVRRSLLYQEAQDRGLDRNPDVQRALERTKQNLMVMELVKEEANKVTVGSTEIENYYNQYKDELKEPEQRHIREIVVLTEAEAKDVLIQLLQGTDFSTLAHLHSKTASARKGGDLGFISPGKRFEQFDKIAFSETLEPGQLSSIFKGVDGYYVLKLEAKRGGKQRTLSEMWDDIKRGLTFLKQQQQLENVVGELSRKARIEIYEDKVK
ncbi:MAG: peptidyl-prolyl cis-trans isomerase [Candidatus Omnitrophica bacterium]|nr:peptidyl-prolyl cis-trans isomerase [Candidatus Omnitrophota bacterium]